MRKTFRKFLAVLVTALFLMTAAAGPAAWAADYYVATTGSDGAAGTLAAPFKTLEKGASTMKAGDTLYIRGGTYKRTAWSLNVPSGGGSWATATTIKAYNGETVIVTPQDTSPGTGTDVIQLPAGRSYIIFDGLILDGLRKNGTGGGRMAFRFADGPVGGVEAVNPSHHIRIQNSELRNTFHSVILTNDAHHLELLNLKLHGSAVVYGIYMSSGHNLMQNCIVYNNGLEGNKSGLAGHGGFGIHNYSGGHSYRADNNVFIGNITYGNEKSGFIIASGTGAKLINNISYGNGHRPTYKGESRYGIEVSLGAQNTQVYNNTTFNNGKGEIRIVGNASNTKVINNIFYGTNASDYTVHLAAKNTSLDHNVIYNANASFRLLNQEPATVTNTINSNPNFVNAAGGDFHLTTGSPAIDAGVTLAEVTFDHDYGKRPFGPAYDIGAYEHGSTPGEVAPPGWTGPPGTGGTGGDLGMKDQNCIPPSQPVNLGISVPAGAAGKVYVSPLVISAFSADSGTTEKYVFTLNAGAPMPNTEGMVWEVPISALGGLTVTPPVGFEGPLAIGVSIIPPFTP